jgi:prepilin-type N-terminal cleavage/methylation domain-containing protein
MTHIHSNKGFTLIEILIASSISLVIMLTILSAFRTGIFGYHAIDQALATERGAYQALDRIRLDLKNSLVYADKQSGFKGESAALSFLTQVDTFQGDAWHRELARVSYRWDGKALVRSCRTGVKALNEQSEARSEELDIPSGKFAVHYGALDQGSGNLSFADSWDPAQGLPAEVRIDMTFNDVPFERVVTLPVAKTI